MRTKLLLIALAVFLAAAMVGGTMAWFTAKAEADDAAFTAGTVMIRAGSSKISSQYFDPDQGVFVYGIEGKSGDVYEIDVINKIENKIYTNPNSYSGWYPNALAFDNANDRLYFARNNSQLWFYDFSADALVIAGSFDHSSKTGSAHVYGATFGGGYYWYVPNGTSYLYKVTLDNDGKIVSSTFVEMADDENLQFGDVVIDYVGGMIYGSDTSFYFTYDITNDIFTKHGTDGRNLQLAWGHNGLLYGHSTSTPFPWYEVKPENGSKTFQFNGERDYYDLASGYVSYWNPGDCAWKKFFVRNTGTKDIRVRLVWWGEWEFNWEWLWENWEALCFTELGFEALNEAYADEVTYEEIQIQSEWLIFVEYVEGLDDPVEITLCDESSVDWPQDNGYWYYTGDPIANGGEVELCLKVCLSGPLATNEFQGGRYKLSARFEAVQSSNNAPYYEWGTDLYGTP